MTMNIRLATRQDVSEIVRLLADDDLSKKRERYEDPLPEGLVRTQYFIWLNAWDIFNLCIFCCPHIGQSFR
jgi:hypothetical protein